MTRATRVGVMGAGAVGAYLGIELSASGLPVTLVGRRALCEVRSLSAQPLGRPPVTPRADLTVTTDPASLAGVDLVLITTKGPDTTEAAKTLATVRRPGVPVLSLQNGLFNAARIRKAVPGAEVIAGLVTFNIVREEGRFVQATSGPVLTGTGEAESTRVALAAFTEALNANGENARARPDIDALLASKLLLNLNNGICAASGLSVRESLLNLRLRRVFSAAIREGLQILRARGVQPRAIGPLSPALIARLLPLPNVIFESLARKMLTIDASARSSTLQDLERGRRTEIADLNGAVVTMAEEHGLSAPVNAVITRHVQRLERELPHPRFVPPAELEREVGL